MVYKKDRNLLIHQIHDCQEDGTVKELTYRIIAKNDNCIWVIDKLRRTTDCNGITWLYSVLIDITEMKKAQDELAASEERYRFILAYVTDPVLDCDLKKNLFYYSPAFYMKFGTDFPEKGQIFTCIDKTNIVDESDKMRLVDDLKILLAGGKTGDAEYRLRDIDGKYIWFKVHPSAFYNRQGALVRMIVVLSDIDKQKKETQILRKKAELDLLTGLYNRITTMNLVENAIEHSTPKSRHAMFVIDIDNFKKVNDQLGHLCGDQLIVETASQIRKQFREDDIVGRIGGDEFVVFLKNTNSEELILKKAKSLCEVFRGLPSDNTYGSNVSVSVGISCYPYDGNSYEELFRKADSAMYTAKNGGKDDFRIFTNEIDICNFK